MLHVTESYWPDSMLTKVTYMIARLDTKKYACLTVELRQLPSAQYIAQQAQEKVSSPDPPPPPKEGEWSGIYQVLSWVCF